jgi:hypothetical protein
MNYNYQLYNELLNNILDKIYDTGDKQSWHDFILLQDKKAGEGYVSATHYLDNYLDMVEGTVVSEGYGVYRLWSKDKQLPVLTQNKFTSYARDRYKLFIKHKWVNNKYCRIYVESSYCPTCNRRFNKST